VLWQARRQPSRVAILYPRSSEMWDQFHFNKYAQSNGGELCLCCCVSSMVSHYIDYTVEAYSLYLALATDSNIPVGESDSSPALPTAHWLARITNPALPSPPSKPQAGVRPMCQPYQSDL
jgi:hypothetical protein